MLKIYNSLTKQKEPFNPLTPNKVSLYVCGITVYDYCHAGHARAWLVFDTIVRYLRERHFQVKFVRNITDIDDKIINRANENGETTEHLTNRFIQAMHEDADNLGLLKPDMEPKATQYIPKMVGFIEKLFQQGLAYQGDNGDVYFEVRKFPAYGQLSKRDVDSLRSGARIEITESKRDPLDFVLWKMAKPNEPSWDSPWGKGRPGWHLECSVMSMDCLGETFDIHGGGNDLKFPHHENECAQSESATGKKFANTWMHVGFLQINKEKMSKSLGNFFTIRDVLKVHHKEVLRYFMIMRHYRSPVEYSEENLQIARNALERFYTAIRGLDLPSVSEDSVFSNQETSPYEEQFNEAMDDDFNTPIALSVLFDLAKKINKLKKTNKEEALKLAKVFQKLNFSLGLLHEDPEKFLQGTSKEGEETHIEHLLLERKQARLTKNWARADEIRAELTALGISLEDTNEGTLWRRER